MKQVKAREVRVVRHGVIVKAAVISGPDGVESAMLSNLSMWSAGQRVAAARKRRVSKSAQPVELHVSGPIIESMWKEYSKWRRQWRKKMNESYLGL